MLQLQFITHHNERFSYLDSARMALEGGCRWIQLRMKQAGEEEFIETAEQVRHLCDHYQATFIIDDHVEWVHRVKADGVHLGLKDMPVDEARRLLRPDVIIGGTANTIEERRELHRLRTVPLYDNQRKALADSRS